MMIKLIETQLKDVFENKDICKACQGICCQDFGCECSPEDFNNDISLMRKALESGKYSIDFARKTIDAFVDCNGNLTIDLDYVLYAKNEAFYIRARNKHRPIVDIIHREEEEGPCVMWSLEKGCELEYEERPRYGKTIIPVEPGRCKRLYPIEYMIQEWIPYNEELFKLAKEFFDKEWHLYKELNLVL